VTNTAVARDFRTTSSRVYLSRNQVFCGQEITRLQMLEISATRHDQSGQVL